MSNSPVQEEDILTALRRLDPARWPEVLDYIDSIQKATQEVTIPLTARDLLNSGLVGIWADRTDITDNIEFARKLRKTAEHRERNDHDPS